MSEYRRSIPLDTEREYWTVRMGPIPNKPRWHQELYASQSYPFPTREAADRFAENHQRIYPGQEIEVLPPEGSM